MGIVSPLGNQYITFGLTVGFIYRLSLWSGKLFVAMGTSYVEESLNKVVVRLHFAYRKIQVNYNFFSNLRLKCEKVNDSLSDVFFGWEKW